MILIYFPALKIKLKSVPPTLPHSFPSAPVSRQPLTTASKAQLLFDNHCLKVTPFSNVNFEMFITIIIIIIIYKIIFTVNLLTSETGSYYPE